MSKKLGSFEEQEARILGELTGRWTSNSPAPHTMRDRAIRGVWIDEVPQLMRMTAAQMQMMAQQMAAFNIPDRCVGFAQLAVRCDRRRNHAKSIRTLVNEVRDQYAQNDYNVLSVLAAYPCISDAVTLQQMFDIAFSCRFAALSQGLVIDGVYAVTQANCYWRAVYTLSQTVSHRHYHRLNDNEIRRIQTFDYADMKINYASRLFFRTGDDILDE